MSKKYVGILFGFFVAFLMLQFSCGIAKEYRDESAPDLMAETEKEVLLLADRHQAFGIECKDCHGDAQPESGVASETCVGCHEYYNEPVDSNIDPHNAHVPSSACEDCHHAHKPSEMICQGCHLFDIEVP